MALSYRVSCPTCGADWPDPGACGPETAPGEAVALWACPGCMRVEGVTVRLTSAEVAKYRREILKTVQKMCQAYYKAASRLKEKRRALAERIRLGDPGAVEKVRLLEERIASYRPPDTSHLDARARELEEIERAAPAETLEVRCSGCGSPVAVYREGRWGFDVPCPRCSGRLRVELVRADERGAVGS